MMTRRRLLLFALVAVVIVTLGALESQHIISGWLRGEAFYDSRPTSYWRAETHRYIGTSVSGLGPHIDHDVTYRRPSDFWDRLPIINRLRLKASASPFANGGESAHAVLLELIDDPNPHVRGVAQTWLRSLKRSQEK